MSFNSRDNTRAYNVIIYSQTDVRGNAGAIIVVELPGRTAATTNIITWHKRRNNLSSYNVTLYNRSYQSNIGFEYHIHNVHEHHQNDNCGGGKTLSTKVQARQ